MHTQVILFVYCIKFSIVILLSILPIIQDGIELQLGTNHMGPYLLSHLLRPCLKNSGQGRFQSHLILPWHMCSHFKISKNTSIPRIVYLTNLDYRQGLINFEDLNSNKSYDPSTAFYQASSWSLSLLHECFQSQLANILAVQSLSKEFLDDKVTLNTYKMMKQEWSGF